MKDYEFDDKMQDFLEQEEWYQKLGFYQKLKVLESVEDFADIFFRKRIRKLHNACKLAFQWHCGGGVAESEQYVMNELDKVLQQEE